MKRRSAFHSQGDQSGFVVTSEKGMYKTTDGGENWQRVDTGFPESLVRFKRSNLNVPFRSAQASYISNVEHARQVRFADDSSGWIAGSFSPYSALVDATTSGGAHWGIGQGFALHNIREYRATSQHQFYVLDASPGKWRELDSIRLLPM